MTLLAVHCRRDSVEVVADSVRWNNTDSHWTTKVHVLLHMPAVIGTHGPEELALQWRAAVGGSALETLDELVPHVPEALREIWRGIDNRTGSRASGFVVMAGWSHTRGRMVAHDWSSNKDWAPTDITDGGAFWPPPPPDVQALPRSREEWKTLVRRLRQEYALAPRYSGQQCWIEGDVWRTVLGRDDVAQERLLSYPRNTAEHRWMRVGSLHRLGQLGPCPCGSGRPHARCHLALKPLDAPCPCGVTGALWGSCHRIDPASPEIDEHLARYPGDFTHRQGELAELWQRAFPDGRGEHAPRLAVAVAGA